MKMRSMVPPHVKRMVRKGLNIVSQSTSPTMSAKKFSPNKEDEEKWILDTGIDTVLDIGAHSGDFSKHYRSLLPNAVIYAFEPLPGPFSTLVDVMRGDERFFAYQCAL